jgi:predicted DNA binding CopG/RHH family protein
MKKIPKFKNEEAEREFWATNSPLDYFDITKARRVDLPNLKPSLKSISLRLPEGMIDALKVMANHRDIPYQSLIKLLIASGIEKERKKVNE